MNALNWSVQFVWFQNFDQFDLCLQEALSQISEYSEAGITVRGTYFTAKQVPKEDERKLYLAIEATTELAIQKAKKEITRLIKEELVRLVSIIHNEVLRLSCGNCVHEEICPDRPEP